MPGNLAEISEQKSALLAGLVGQLSRISGMRAIALGGSYASGFYSVIYLAEVQICIPLYDPDRLIADLKRQVEIYPTRLKRRIIQDSLWSAEFTLLQAHGFARQGDIYNTAGCLTRVASNLTQALFAINERYFLREKQVLKQIAMFSQLPTGYIEQVEHFLACPGSTTQALTTTVNDLELLWRRITNLPRVAYKPQFRL